VRLPAEGSQDQNVEVLETGPGLGRNAAAVGEVSHVADTVSEDAGIAVVDG